MSEFVDSGTESGQYHVESGLVHNYPVEVKTGFNESDPGYYNHSTVLKNGPREHQWFYTSDSWIQTAPENDVKSSQAYLLLYKRRRTNVYQEF